MWLTLVISDRVWNWGSRLKKQLLTKEAKKILKNAQTKVGVRDW